MTEFLKARLEFEVENLGKENIELLRNELVKLKGIDGIIDDIKNSKVYIDTYLPTFQLEKEIEKITGTYAILKGMGSAVPNSLPNLDAAVAEVCNRKFEPMGVIRFVQLDNDFCAIDGTIDGLNPLSQHAINVHEYGDLTDEFNKIGNRFNQLSKTPTDVERQTGDLGYIKANEEGRSMFRIVNTQLKTWDIIGRSICVSQKPDSNNNSTGEKMACGIIARAANVFENTKRICACSGRTLWEEKRSKI